MKKFIYGFLIFFVSLTVLIVVAANSSFVIKKAADTFAPDYNISYSDIRGNIFTGVSIDGLKFGEMNLAGEIRFSWNPSKILYKHIDISEVTADDIDVDTVKALIASFPGSDDNSTSDPFPLVVTVGKIHVSTAPFTEQGIHFEKTLLYAKDISYAADEVEVGDLGLDLDTNLTKLRLHASLEEGKVRVHSLDISDIDSEALQTMFMPTEGEEDHTSGDNTSAAVQPEKREPLNPLIPKEVEVSRFSASLKPRKYLDTAIDGLSLRIDDVKADVVKILDNKAKAISIGKCLLALQSDVGQVKVTGSLEHDTVTLDEVSAIKIDTLALKAMFAPDSNGTHAVPEENVTQPEPAEGVPIEEKMDAKGGTSSALIPQKIIVKKLHTDVLPAVYEPVHVKHFAVDGYSIIFNVPKLVVEKGELDITGQTNLSNIKEHSTIKNNHLDGHIVLTPNQHLFDFYKLPLRKEAIGDIVLDFTASKEQVSIDLEVKAKHILLVQKEVNATDGNVTDINGTVVVHDESNATEPFNVDINKMALHANYLIDEKRAEATLNVNVTTPYATESTLDARFRMDGEALAYGGALKAGDLSGFDANLLKPLNGLTILFKGDEKHVKTTIDSKSLTGYFNVPDFTKKGVFHLATKSAVEVGALVKLPEALETTKVDFAVDVPVNFAKLIPIKGKAKVRSNVANVDVDILYGDALSTLTVVTKIPKNSLLKNFDRNIRWSAISPLRLGMKMDKKSIRATLKSSKLSADMNMLPFEKKIDGKVRLAGLSASLKMGSNGEVVIKSDVGSFETLMSTVNQFYHVEKLPKVEGKLDIQLLVKNNSDATLTLTSPQVRYYADRKTVHNIDDVKVSLGVKGGDTLLLKSYQLTYNKMHFFATKPSEVKFVKETMTVPQLWLNDELKVAGKLNTKTLKGEISADAPKFHFSHEFIDFESKIGLKALFKGGATDVTGKVTLLGGDVHYDLGTKTFPSDSDILIVQEMKKPEPNPFVDNLTMLINVDTQQPLVYKQGPVYAKANVELGIHKAVNSDPMVIGSVDIVDGSSYTFQGKRFILERSHIYFTGDPTKPMLDITVKYQALRHLITINVTGTPAVPNILFSSVPSLTKEQILSIILFDSEDLAGSNNADDMMKMMGGAMAKSALNNLGVKIDHLVIGEGNSVEVGKKITDNTTVIYINGEVPKMEVKYKYSPSIEVVVGASEESESLDVVYIKDFNMDSDDDIVIKGRGN